MEPLEFEVTDEEGMEREFRRASKAVADKSDREHTSTELYLLSDARLVKDDSFSRIEPFLEGLYFGGAALDVRDEEFSEYADDNDYIRAMRQLNKELGEGNIGIRAFLNGKYRAFPEKVNHEFLSFPVKLRGRKGMEERLEAVERDVMEKEGFEIEGVNLLYSFSCGSWEELRYSLQAGNPFKIRLTYTMPGPVPGISSGEEYYGRIEVGKSDLEGKLYNPEDFPGEDPVERWVENRGYS